RVEDVAAPQAILYLRVRQRLAQRSEPPGGVARVRHAQGRTLPRAPARGSHAGLAQSKDQDARRIGAKGLGTTVHRNFKVERPISTSIMLMIQKRTTTWVSFQPPTSK